MLDSPDSLLSHVYDIFTVMASPLLETYGLLLTLKLLQVFPVGSLCISLFYREALCAVGSEFSVRRHVLCRFFCTFIIISNNLSSTLILQLGWIRGSLHHLRLPDLFYLLRSELSFSSFN